MLSGKNANTKRLKEDEFLVTESDITGTHEGSACKSGDGWGRLVGPLPRRVKYLFLSLRESTKASSFSVRG